MEQTKTADSLNKVAKIISVIFHPVFVPLFGLILIFSAPTVYSYLPLPAKGMLFIIVLINNIVFPLILLVFFKAINHNLSWKMETRRERMFPLVFVTILYAITSYIIIRYPVSAFIKIYFTGIFFIVFLITIINNWWKISIHAAGAGVLTALVLILSFRMYNVTILPLIMVIIIAGLILSSRLRLNSNTHAQTWFGFLLGFIVLCMLYGVV